MRPKYAELTARGGTIPGCAWDLWGEGDQLGAFNDVTEQHAADAARLVQRGAVFPLSWSMTLPSPPLFSRGPMRHVINDVGFAMDDHFDQFFPQCSSQWDALSHYSHPEHGFYGGRDSAQLKGPDARNGIEHLARRGVATRFVLADIGRWRERVGRPIDHAAGEHVPLTDLHATLAAQGVEVRLGDVLMVRFGWTNWYEQTDTVTREALAVPGAPVRHSGLEPGDHVVGWIWDSGAVAVVSDAVALEAFPFPPRGVNLHSYLIALLGIPIGEMWALDALAADCAADGRYTGLLTAAPLNIPGGVGSPANALALK